MANDAYTQQALAQDAGFQRRFQNALMKIAWQVLNEDAGIANHAARADYARKVIASPSTYVNALVSSFVTRPNVLNFATSAVFGATGVSVITASGDPDLESQLNTDWNALAGA